MAESRTEDLFIDLIKGTTTDFEPQSRFESYMKCIINKTDPAETPTPESRKDVLMKIYAEQVYNGGGGGSNDNKFTQLVDGTISEVTAEDLKGVTSIRNYVFSDCGRLTSITMLSTTPPTIGSSIFPSGFSGTITVPAGTGDAYKAATNWSVYADKIQEAAV